MQGQGRTIILIDGALGYRSFGPMPELAKLLSEYFTVITYDRRGRGDSGDTKPYYVEKEIEDIDALIDEVGDSIYLYGISSGACLTLEAAVKLGQKVKKLAIYEAPYNSEVTDNYKWREYTERLTNFLAMNRRSDAVALFMTFVGTPSAQIEGMRNMPMWSLFEAIAHTLLYDASVMGIVDRSVPVERVSAISASTLVMHGGAGLSFIKQAAFTLSKAIHNAEFRTLEGQTHAASSDVIAPVLIEFFKKQGI
jgi:pimeloyl-ACP methyl ester carboxylesterase